MADDIDWLRILPKMIPGMIVTAVGGIVTAVLPGKAKIAGLVPTGVGLFMMFQAFAPGTLTFFTEPNYPKTANAGSKFRIEAQIINDSGGALNVMFRLVDKDTQQIVPTPGTYQGLNPGDGLLCGWDNVDMPNHDYHLIFEIGTYDPTVGESSFNRTDSRELTVLLSASQSADIQVMEVL